MLFDDDNWKRRGIGKLLFKEAHKYAAKLGAEKIFISAIPSIETTAFYQKIGCTDANEIIKSFVDSEDDRYMEYVVNISSMPCDCDHDCARYVTDTATQNSDDHLRKQSQGYWKKTLGINEWKEIIKVYEKWNIKAVFRYRFAQMDFHFLWPRKTISGSKTAM